jgi:hypothetical protein
MFPILSHLWLFSMVEQFLIMTALLVPVLEYAR